MTLANRITLGRLALIPVFLWAIMAYTGEDSTPRLAALVMFILAAVSDGVDGYVARRFNQRTKVGAVLDPLADKLLINLAFVFLAVNRSFETPLPYWFPVLMLGRDILIVMGSYVIHEYLNPNMRVVPRWGGKVNTVFQFATVIAVLLEFPWAPHIVFAATFVAILSFIDYAWAGMKRVEHEERA